MAYGRKSWVAEILLEDPEEIRRNVSVKVATYMFGSTSGPWGGIGGAAMTDFTMTLLQQTNGLIIYADERRMGYVKKELEDDAFSRFPRIHKHMIDPGRP